MKPTVQIKRLQSALQKSTQGGEWLTVTPDLAAFDLVVLDTSDEAAAQAAFEAIGPFDHLFITAGPALRSWGSFMDPDMRGDRSYLEGKFLGNWACARHAAPHFRNLGWDWKGERKGSVGTVKNLNPRNSP
ncbi:MAG: hypothetical protein B7Z75_13485 [Acidocella sp. 20-57-95]|nr:MAG: hypothetical protein B7Z75_13485 [Acidocella sp. 20-57-95]HQT65686.1 hypothetical protein [Acidocella sp.]